MNIEQTVITRYLIYLELMEWRLDAACQGQEALAKRIECVMARLNWQKKKRSGYRGVRPSCLRLVR